MDNQGLNDEEFKDSLEILSHSVDALKNDIPVYMIRGKDKERQTPLEIVQGMKRETRRMISILRRYDR